MNSSQFQLNFIPDHSVSAIFGIFTLFSVLYFTRSSSLLPISSSEVCSVHCNRLSTETNFVQIVCLEQLPLVFFVSNLRAGSKLKTQTTSPPPNSLKLLAATRSHLVRFWYVVFARVQCALCIFAKTSNQNVNCTNCVFLQRQRHRFHRLGQNHLWCVFFYDGAFSAQIPLSFCTSCPPYFVRHFWTKMSMTCKC